MDIHFLTNRGPLHRGVVGKVICVEWGEEKTPISLCTISPSGESNWTGGELSGISSMLFKWRKFGTDKNHRTGRYGEQTSFAKPWWTVVWKNKYFSNKTQIPMAMQPMYFSTAKTKWHIWKLITNLFSFCWHLSCSGQSSKRLVTVFADSNLASTRRKRIMTVSFTAQRRTIFCSFQNWVGNGLWSLWNLLNWGGAGDHPQDLLAWNLQTPSVS